jgi:hypothetical protein
MMFERVAQRTCLALAVVMLAQVGCKKSEKKDEPTDPPPAALVSSNELDQLRASADMVLDALAALESERDVTCWTSFRQLDWFIAEKSYGEFATLAKVAAGKALVRSAWAKASAVAEGNRVSAEDFAKAIDLPEVALGEATQNDFATFTNDIGLKNYSDYQKTAEHWRLVLAVLQDEMVETGGKPTLKAIDKGGLESLANAATTISLMLLKDSSAAADAASSEHIEAEHINKAYQAIAKETGLASAPRQRSPLPPELIAKHLQPLTRRLIDGKFKALQTFNKGGIDIQENLNRVARMPLTPEAIQVLQRDLQSFVHFVAAGYSPMRADNYLSDGSFAKEKIAGRSYLDELHAQNVVMQLFPHRILANGDILVRFEPNPGPMTKLKLEPFEIRILDHEMNGVRDSAIHWLVARIVWDERPFAMDPFAAEYLTEVVSMMLATWMHRSELIAKETGKTSVDVEVAKRVRSKTFVMVPPADPKAVPWNPEQAAAKKALLAQYKKPLFRDVTAQSGLPTKLEAFDEEGQRIQSDGSAGPTAFDLQTIMGGGIAVGDVNGDGLEDLYLTGESLGRLYLNDAKRPGHFTDATESMGLPTDLDDGHGTLLFDFEGDGDQDLLVLRSKNSSALFLQDKGRFSDAASALGFKTHYGAHVAHVFDYDRDGDLDILVGYYGSREAHEKKGQARSLPSLDGRNGSPNQLWRNDGDKLINVAAQAGLGDVGWALAISSFDYDADGFLDIYVANDFGANAMFRNKGDGSFEDVTKAMHTGDRGSGMNVDVTDVNGDGKWDFYVTNIDMFSKNIKVVFPRDESTIDINESLTRAFQYLSGNKLYVSNADGGFTAEEHLRFEPHDRGWGWDAAFFDVENDGDDDIYVTNGWVQGSYAGGQKNQFYLNDKAYYYMSDESGPEAFAGNTRSAAAVDIDNDGDLDLVANNFRQAPRVLTNEQKSKNGWLRLQLRGKGKNPQGLGARVQITAGDRSILRQVSGGRGYLSQGPKRIYAGMGAANQADVKVFWPDGSVSELKGLKPNVTHTLEQP